MQRRRHRPHHVIADEAGQHFGAAQALEPQSSLFDFNQGAVQAKKGNLEGAVRYWTRAAETAIKQGDPAISGRALFNLGDALAKSGHYEEAAQSYAASVGLAKQGKDNPLEQSARKNLELLRQQQEQQQKQQQQDQQQQNQDQKKEQDQKEQQQKEQQQKDQDQKDQKKGKEQEAQKSEQVRQNRKQPFKSQKLTPEDAERVMNELKDREKSLQGKLNKKKGNPRSAGKDW
jgi:tetratricopeptide (TPR) repeat protein